MRSLALAALLATATPAAALTIDVGPEGIPFVRSGDTVLKPLLGTLSAGLNTISSTLQGDCDPIVGENFSTCFGDEDERDGFRIVVPEGLAVEEVGLTLSSTVGTAAGLRVDVFGFRLPLVEDDPVLFPFASLSAGGPPTTFAPNAGPGTYELFVGVLTSATPGTFSVDYTYAFTAVATDPPPVPLPAGGVLIISALAALGLVRRRRG